MKHSMYRLLIILLILVLTAASVSAGIVEEEPSVEMTPLYFHQIDLGCANGDLITVGSTVILVDCGTDTDDEYSSNKGLLEYLAAAGIDHIDYWIVTHYHNDHAINLNILLELYGTDDTVIYGPSSSLPGRFLPLAAGSYIQLKDGDSFSVGDISFLCLGPESAEVTGENNADSLNVRMDYGETSFMITGDYVHDALNVRHPDEIRDIDVLIFPHHGLKPFYISKNIINKMNSSIVLLTARNGAAVREFCNVVNTLHASVYSSSHDGNIVLVSNGICLETYLQAEPGQFPVVN